MKVITSLAGASAICLAAPSCKGGESRGADTAPERPITRVQQVEMVGDPAMDPLALVLDPDDEAFDRAREDATGGPGEREEGKQGKVEGRGPVFTVKGVIKEVDPSSGRIVLEQLLADGKRHDVRFWVDGETHMGWSKASMQMALGDLPAGITIYVTYHVVGTGGKRRNRALKIIIPGGMEDAAKMILAEPEAGDPAAQPAPGD